MAIGFDGILGDGVKLAYKTGSPAAWTQLAPLMDLPAPPAADADEIENTAHGSGGMHTFTAGLGKVPNITAVLLFDAADPAHIDMITLQNSKEVKEWRIEVPTLAGTFLPWEFEGTVKKAAPTTGINELQHLNLEVLYTGELVIPTAAEASEIGV